MRSTAPLSIFLTPRFCAANFRAVLYFPLSVGTGALEIGDRKSPVRAFLEHWKLEIGTIENPNAVYAPLSIFLTPRFCAANSRALVEREHWKLEIGKARHGLFLEHWKLEIGTIENPNALYCSTFYFSSSSLLRSCTFYFHSDEF
jgi:hypothetical protein